MNEGQRLTNWMDEKLGRTGGRVSFGVTHNPSTRELEFSISIYESRLHEKPIRTESMKITEELMPYMRNNVGIIEELIKRFKEGIRPINEG